MGSRFLGFVGSLPPDEQKIWLPNQSAHDPQTWLAPNLLHLKSEYEVLLNKHNCKEQESYLVQDQPLPPSDTLLLLPLSSLYKVHMRNQEMPQTGDSRPGDATIATYSVQSGDEEYGDLGQQHCKGYEQEDALAMGPS
jgi:hypothetical protein